MENKLIQSCLQGNRKAQKRLYDDYKIKMFNLCMRYAKSREEAEDFLLEGFHKVFRDLKDFKVENSFDAWLRKIMINTALMNLRKKKFFATFPINEEITESAPISENDFLLQMNANEIIYAIQQLPIGYQTIFNLFAIEGFSHKEIALQLNIAESTSRSQYNRAKKSLQKSLSQKQAIHQSLKRN